MNMKWQIPVRNQQYSICPNQILAWSYPLDLGKFDCIRYFAKQSYYSGQCKK